MARLLRREGKFFDFFNEHADLAMLAAAELKALLEDIGELELRRRNIERYEKQADHITHQTIALLQRDSAPVRFSERIPRRRQLDCDHRVDASAAAALCGSLGRVLQLRRVPGLWA
jgi:hypothetical protein